MLKQVEIFTDGSCLGNPGPGGYGAILRYRGREKTFSAGYTRTTNNRMELMAAIVAARVSPSGSITGKNVAGKPQTKNQ